MFTCGAGTSEFGLRSDRAQALIIA